MYFLCAGTVQPYVASDGDSPYFCFHFGFAEYERDKPVVKDHHRKEAQPIIDKLNAGELSHEEAKDLLSKIW